MLIGIYLAKLGGQGFPIDAGTVSVAICTLILLHNVTVLAIPANEESYEHA